VCCFSFTPPLSAAPAFRTVLRRDHHRQVLRQHPAGHASHRGGSDRSVRPIPRAVSARTMTTTAAATASRDRSRPAPPVLGSATIGEAEGGTSTVREAPRDHLVPHHRHRSSGAA